MFLILFYFTHYIEGSFSFAIPLVLSMIWLGHSAMLQNINKLLFNRVAIWWWAYLFLCVMMVFLGFSSTNINFIVSRLPMYIIPCVGYFVVYNYNIKEKKLLLFTFILIFGGNLISNIMLGIAIPEIFEEQESTEMSIQYGIMMNLAGYGFINVCLWLLGCMLMILLVHKKNGLRFVIILFAIPIAYHMLMQNTRGTAIILLAVEIIGIIMALFEPNGKRRKLYYLSFSIIMIIIIFVFFIPIISFVLDNMQSERLAQRFNSLLDLRQVGGDINQVNDGSFAQRLMLAQTSLNSFLSSPISFLIGIGDHSVSFGGDLEKSGIGNHSEFIDVSARYGILGIIVFWNILKNYLNMLKQVAGYRYIYRFVVIIFFIFIVMGFLNPVFEPIQLLFLFVVFPIIIDLVKCSYEKNLIRM